MKSVLTRLHCLRTSRPVLTAAFAGLALSVSPASAAVTEAWVQRYSGMQNNSNDVAVAVVRDAAGDTVVAGNSDDGVNGFDFLTIKYSGADGSVLWRRRYNNPAGGPFNADEVRGMAADGHGNVVVTGRTRHDGQGRQLVHREVCGCGWRADLGKTLRRRPGGL